MWNPEHRIAADRSETGAEWAIATVIAPAVGQDFPSFRGVMRRNGNPARPARAVAPGMVGAALHDGIAGFKIDLFGVEHQRDLAF